MIAYLVNKGLQGSNTPHRPKRFHLSTERDNHAFLGLIPSLASFPCFLPLQTKTFSFCTERDLHTLLGLLAFLHLISFMYRKRNLLIIANFDNLGYQGFQGLQSFQGTTTLQHTNTFQHSPTNSNNKYSNTSKIFQHIQTHSKFTHLEKV